MSLSNSIKQAIANQVIRTLHSQFDKFPSDESNNRNAPFHEAFLGAFSDKLNDKVTSIPTLISLSSWLHGLNTSLGQSFFENTAHILCGGTKKEFVKNRESGLKIEDAHKSAIATIIKNLSNGDQSPSLANEHKAIFAKPTQSKLVESTDFTADVYFENTQEVVCIEIKTVKPNKGTFKGEKEKILQAKAALKTEFPNLEVHYFLAFPFDPLNETAFGHDKQRFMNNSVGFTKFFDKAEILLAGEFWDYLAGCSNTMESIVGIINAIATPDFMQTFNTLGRYSPRTATAEQKQAHLSTLRAWHLYQECELIEKADLLASKLATKKLQNLYNQSCFKGAEYNSQRATDLLELLP